MLAPHRTLVCVLVAGVSVRSKRDYVCIGAFVSVFTASPYLLGMHGGRWSHECPFVTSCCGACYRWYYTRNISPVCD